MTQALPRPDSKPAKDEQILDAALRLFAQFGYRRTSMDDIAREAGMAKGTVYARFESKEAIFRAMQARNAADVLALCDAALDARGLAFHERLYRLLDAHYGLVYERFGASDYLAELNATRTSVGREEAEALDKSYRERIAKLIADAARRGEIDPAKTGLSGDALARQLIGGAVGAKYAGGMPASVSAYRERLAEFAKLAAAALGA
ncbi:MAG: helix-turn-helix domain containing protein [Parvibaculum sp.]|uniref:TetR/AcrR family transcriptional regulator n=1 Tax=Parvibaculum sp. TaxID=2024848 RepID=UPI00283B9A8B|nr:helix-turn-helix domain-containing protein [Parvibaculum sp.]MDR3498423.1 helix-turn-helix domain containing protein [Parvibaculum sp.]